MPERFTAKAVVEVAKHGEVDEGTPRIYPCVVPASVDRHIPTVDDIHMTLMMEP
jgi:hypothetical protein